MIEREKTKTKKKTNRPGRKIGQKSSPVISIKINDPDRRISAQWEMIKQINTISLKETAAETAKRIFISGMEAEQKRLVKLFACNASQDGKEEQQSLLKF